MSVQTIGGLEVIMCMCWPGALQNANSVLLIALLLEGALMQSAMQATAQHKGRTAYSERVGRACHVN